MRYGSRGGEGVQLGWCGEYGEEEQALRETENDKTMLGKGKEGKEKVCKA